MTISTELQQLIQQVRQALTSPEMKEAERALPDCSPRLQQLVREIEQIEGEQVQVPHVEIVLLGTCRHGKSTLLNALMGVPLLPVDDARPCTASIIRVRHSPDWEVKINFIDRQELERQRKLALKEVEESLASQHKGDEECDLDGLKRWTDLYRVNPNQDPLSILRELRGASPPDQLNLHLGKEVRVRELPVKRMRAVLERHLSTKNVFWMIVKDCEVSGPFESWHPRLCLVDLPGTNDLNSHRTEITRSLCRDARAVALVTSDGNLGQDIKSWLQNSPVLARFLEATEFSRQRLFVIRTKFDAYHPSLPEGTRQDIDEAEEERLIQQAHAAYQEQQAKSYLDMIRQMAQPLLNRQADQDKKGEELARCLDAIKVHFVSALAYEAIENRLQTSRKELQSLSEHFNNDAEQTGVPASNGS